MKQVTANHPINDLALALYGVGDGTQIGCFAIETRGDFDGERHALRDVQDAFGILLCYSGKMKVLLHLLSQKSEILCDVTQGKGTDIACVEVDGKSTIRRQQILVAVLHGGTAFALLAACP